jgi:VWFA-related protein
MSLGLGQGPPGAVASQAEERLAEALHVDLVNVDVFVSDSSGAVTGLRAEDFEVSVDGSPVPITNFFAAEPGNHRSRSAREKELAQDPGPLLADERRSYLVIFIDNHGGQPLIRNQALQQLIDLLPHYLEGGHRLMLVSMSDRVRVLHRFSDDSQELAARLEELQSTSVGSSFQATERSGLMAEINRLNPNINTDFALVDRSTIAQEAAGLAARISLYAAGLQENVRSRLAVLDQFIGRLAGLQGHKALLYIGEGFETEPGRDLLQIWDERYSDVTEEQNRPVDTNASRYRIDEELRSLARQANASGVTCFTLFTSGAQQRFAPLAAESGAISGTSGVASSIRRSLEDSLAFLASATGGQVLTPGEGPQSDLGGLAGRIGTFYSIGFAPPDHGDGKEVHDLKIRVKRDKVQVRHRQQYRYRTIDEQMSEITTAVLLYEPGANPLSAGVLVDGGSSELAVTVTVPLARLALVPVRGSHIGRVKLYFALKDGRGRISAVRSQQMPITIPNSSLLTALGQDAAIPLQLNLDRGRHDLAVTLRDDLSGLVATTTASLEIGPDGVLMGDRR